MYRILNFNDWLEETQFDKYNFTDKYIKETYDNYVLMTQVNNEHVKNYGYPKCHCNICLHAIEEYQGYKKYDQYYYKGHLVRIDNFCPLENCSEIISCQRELVFVNG